MKRLLMLALAVGFVVSGCGSPNENPNNGYNQNGEMAGVPADTYCLQYGQYDQARCPGIYGYGYGAGYAAPGFAPYRYWNHGGGQYYAPHHYSGYSNLNYAYGSGGYGGGYGSAYGYSGCGPGSAPVYSGYGMSCYQVSSGAANNYYWWNNQQQQQQGGANYNYGGYPGFLVACGMQNSGTCPSGYTCSSQQNAGYQNNGYDNGGGFQNANYQGSNSQNGLGVCVRL